MAGRRRVVAIALVMAAVTVTASCIPARSGARCRTDQWGRNATHALRCINGRWRPLMTLQQAAAALASLLGPAEGEVVRPATLPSPQLPNTADPAVFVEGGTTYVYATSTYHRVPVMALSNLDAVHTPDDIYWNSVDAMPTTPSWASSTAIWAPTVERFGDQYVMFFAAQRKFPPNPAEDECVGRARSGSPLGPFVPEPMPVHCGNDGINGALDPSIFSAPDGSRWLLMAMSGSTTNIWTVRLDANATLVSAPVPLATRDKPWEQVFLENPSMYFDGSTYLLAYSNNNWQTEAYSTAIARCASPTGPCTDRNDGPWLTTAGGRAGPGGLSFFTGPDGAARVAFHSYAIGDIGPVGKRSTSIARLHTDPWPRLG